MGRHRGASVFAGELVDRAAAGEPVSVRFGAAPVNLVYVGVREHLAVARRRAGLAA